MTGTGLLTQGVVMKPCVVVPYRYRKRKLFPSWLPLLCSSTHFLQISPPSSQRGKNSQVWVAHASLHLPPVCLHTRPLCARAWGVVAVSSALDKTFTALGRALRCCWLPSHLGSEEDQTICHSLVLPLSLLILFISTHKIWLTSAVLLNLMPYQRVRPDFSEAREALSLNK